MQKQFTVSFMDARLPVWIDSDNALGSAFGDIDDAFAIATLLRSGLPTFALASVFGNTFESLCYRNHLSLINLLGSPIPVFHGATTWWQKDSGAARQLRAITHDYRILAIGPLSTIKQALRRDPRGLSCVKEIVFLGTNFRFRFPVTGFTDFNVWKDRAALRTVLASTIPLTIVPCDVARQLRATRKLVNEIPGKLGNFLSRDARRWFIRAKILKASNTIPVWDLTAAMYVLHPELFKTTKTDLFMTRFGNLVYGTGKGRQVVVVTDFDPVQVWKIVQEYLGQTLDKISQS
jgi:inosine-uridine nucleoside N-ribohydrolase